jgi:hypothetical protein
MLRGDVHSLSGAETQYLVVSGDNQSTYKI